MFDMQEDFRENVQEKLAHGPLDARALLEAIAALSPAEFAELEDDLDFAQFTGAMPATKRARCRSPSCHRDAAS